MSLKNSSATIKIHKLFKEKLKNKRIRKIYKVFEKSLNIDKGFVVAVSGGPDSLALSFLAKIYSIKNRLSSKFLIVDHKLRPESSKEAKLVKKILESHFIKSEILTIKGRKPSKNIQASVRKKRYELLLKRCKELKMRNILLGHHEEDLLENFFIRVLRGSGLRGLISLDKKTKYENIALLRPLLDQKKEDLIFVSKHVFNFFVKDPSNNDEKYQRIRIRKLILGLQKDGLDKKKLKKTIRNLKYSDNAISFYVEENTEKNTFYHKDKNKLILKNEFFQNSYEVIFRSLSNAVKFIGGRYYSVRGKKLDKILKLVENKRPFKVTLGGCILEKVNQTVIISKEH